MLELPGYTGQHLLQDAEDAQLYRAMHTPSGEPCMLKVARDDPGVGSAASRLRHEHAFAASLAGPALARPSSLLERGGRVELMLDPVGGTRCTN